MNEVLAMMAVAYVTYVIVESRFPPVAWARDWILDDTSPAILYLLTCWWCTSFWVSIIVSLGMAVTGNGLRVPVLFVFAAPFVAGLTGMIYGVLEMLHANLVKGLTSD